jgi:hypothetical protein
MSHGTVIRSYFMQFIPPATRSSRCLAVNSIRKLNGLDGVWNTIAMAKICRDSIFAHDRSKVASIPVVIKVGGEELRVG